MRIAAAPAYRGQTLMVQVSGDNVAVEIGADGFAEVDDAVGYAMLKIGPAFQQVFELRKPKPAAPVAAPVRTTPPPPEPVKAVTEPESVEASPAPPSSTRARRR